MKVWSYVFAVAGLLALGYWAYEHATARLFQAREAAHFPTEPKAESHPAEVVIQPEDPSTGSTIAMLEIPRLGLSTVVVEGAEERELKLGPGHIRGTSLPGGGGNVGVAGHRDTVFRPLRFIRINDAIKVITHEREYEYKVVSTQIVAPRDVQVLYPTGRETLTLVTCYPFDFVGAAPKRFIVSSDCVNCARRDSMELGRGSEASQ
jgi:sortase A